MKKTPHALTRLFTLLLASLTILSISVAAAGTAGSSSDPLVTLSYLNEKFLPELMTRVDEKARRAHGHGLERAARAGGRRHQTA